MFVYCYKYYVSINVFVLYSFFVLNELLCETWALSAHKRFLKVMQGTQVLAFR